jgi:hypothetical protein
MDCPLCLLVKKVHSGWLAFCLPCLVRELSLSALADLKINFFNGGE